jgi:hypothetical protein
VLVFGKPLANAAWWNKVVGFGDPAKSVENLWQPHCHLRKHQQKKHHGNHHE